MSDLTPPSKPPNIQAELAKERNRAAAERTLMAWIRTSLSLIGFGFGIATIVNSIMNFQNLQDIDRVRASSIFGLAFIALGIYAIVAATIAHRQELQRIRHEADYFYQPRRSIGLTVATGLICIGLIAFMAILWRIIT